MKAAPLVKITFNVAAPNDTVQGAPIRIAGNLLELGNTFADLDGGLSTTADRMPIMSLQPDGHYSVTISLPVGAYVQYKYSLGDGFLNAEHKATGEFVLREFIVPAQDTLIQDSIEYLACGRILAHSLSGDSTIHDAHQRYCLYSIQSIWLDRTHSDVAAWQ